MVDIIPVFWKIVFQYVHNIIMNAAQHTKSSQIEHSRKSHLAVELRQQMLNGEMQTGVLCPPHLGAILHSKLKVLIKIKRVANNF